MLAVDLKTPNLPAVKFPDQPIVSGVLNPNAFGPAGQTITPVHRTDRSQGTADYTSRLFSPYLTPSAILTENRQLAQGAVSPAYQQNIAATKYFNISTTPKLRPHLHTNLIA
jgi:hypothetical protein